MCCVYRCHSVQSSWEMFSHSYILPTPLLSIHFREITTSVHVTSCADIMQHPYDDPSKRDELTAADR